MSGSYRHHVRKIAKDDYFISWTFDRKVAGSRLRFPMTMTRVTNEKNARAFAKRHGIAFPEK